MNYILDSLSSYYTAKIVILFSVPVIIALIWGGFKIYYVVKQFLCKHDITSHPKFFKCSKCNKILVDLVIARVYDHCGGLCFIIGDRKLITNSVRSVALATNQNIELLTSVLVIFENKPRILEQRKIKLEYPQPKLCSYAYEYENDVYLTEGLAMFLYHQRDKIHLITSEYDLMYRHLADYVLHRS